MGVGYDNTDLLHTELNFKEQRSVSALSGAALQISRKQFCVYQDEMQESV